MGREYEEQDVLSETPSQALSANTPSELESELTQELNEE